MFAVEIVRAEETCPIVVTFCNPPKRRRPFVEVRVKDPGPKYAAAPTLKEVVLIE
jgi:hypothetical protein